jgi:glycyl-tRNA synthetase beta chain
MEFLREREFHIFERRGFRPDETRAVAAFWKHPSRALRRIEALSKGRQHKDFEALAVLFKRVKNITKGFDGKMRPELEALLTEPSEQALLREIDNRFAKVSKATGDDDYAGAVREMIGFAAPVDKFFADVLVMADDPKVREARLTLLTMLRRTVLNIADISELVVEEKPA